MRREQRLQELLRLMLPEELQPQLSLPKMLVLTGQSSGQALSQQLVQEFEADVNARAAKAERRDTAVRYLPNLMLSDWDALITFAVIDEVNFSESGVTLAADSVRLRLQRCTPTLPDWAIEGFMALFATVHFQDDRVALEPMKWISATETQRLVDAADAPRILLPMSELVAPLTAEQRGDAEHLARWRAQAALFLRWALDGKGAPARAPFWKFVARTREAPPTEALFEECFGMGSSDVRDRLSDYLPLAVKKGIALSLEERGDGRMSRPREATPAEIARIKGDWDRLAVGFVTRRSPEHVGQYLALARTTLQRGMQEETVDPRVQAVLGLTELETGRAAEARPLLDAAVAGNATGPRAYIELARLRLLEAQIRVGGAGNQLSAAEAEGILRPLAQARTQAPPIALGYVVAAQTWFQSAYELQPADQAVIAEGLRLFPRDPSILYTVALLRASRGARAEAAALVQRGLALELPPAVRGTFEKLRETLGKRE
jgi:hypothetical protein